MHIIFKSDGKSLTDDSRRVKCLLRFFLRNMEEGAHAIVFRNETLDSDEAMTSQHSNRCRRPFNVIGAALDATEVEVPDARFTR
jgi:hypothetical protein